MYYSIRQTKEETCANPGDKIDLSDLTNPDADNEKQYGFTDDFLSRIVGAMLFERDFLRDTLDLIKPSYFRNNYVRQLAAFIQSYYRQYDAIPDKATLINHFENEPADKKLLLTVAIDEACDYEQFYRGVQPVQHLIDEATEFARLQALRTAYNRSLDIAKARKADWYNEVWSTIDEARNVGASNQELSGLDIFGNNFLEGENLEWIVDSFLPAGNTMMLSGPPKAGKSLISLWLTKCITYGEPFLGGTTHGKRPIVICDWENPRSYVSNWAKKFVGDRDTKPWSENVSYFTSSAHPSGTGTLPDYLTLDFLRAITNKREKGVIIVDTVRGAFHAAPNLQPGWENTASEISRLIRPIQIWSHTSGWAVIFLHHFNRLGSPSGSTELLAASDLVCNFTRDLEGIERDPHECSFVVLGRLSEPIDKRLMQFTGKGFEYLGTVKDAMRKKEQAEAEEIYQATKQMLIAGLVPTVKYNNTDMWDKLKLLGVTNNSKKNEYLKRMKEAKELNCEREGKEMVYTLPKKV